MKPDYPSFVLPAQGDATETVRQNLEENSQRIFPLHQARAFWLGELIYEFSPAEIPERDAVRDLRERMQADADADDVYTAALHYADTVALCKEIALAYPDGYERTFTELFGTHQLPTPQAAGRVAYVANSYTEQAFMELTGFIKERRVAYFHHFDDVCQEVDGGLCEYGILPVESTAQGLMAGLFRLIELYGLRICALCRVKTDQDAYTSFALVRKSLAPTQPSLSHCIDFLCTPAEPGEISELVSIASLFGHRLVHTATYQGREDETFRLRFDAHPDTLYPFFIYLALFCADITPIGFYKIK